MKRCLFIAGITATILPGCVPTTNLYQTPALYFGSSHAVPVTDSANQLSVSAAVAYPVIAGVRSEYRINRNFLASLSYAGNFGGYTHYSDYNIEYRYRTNSFDFQAGYIDRRKHNNKGRLFIMAGYGSGRNTSIVPEDDNSAEFLYNGKFSRFSITPGVYFAPNKTVHFSFSWRQSFIRFRSYELPDTVYFDKKQLLTDVMFRCSLKAFKNTWVHLFLGSYLNGTKAGDRQFDPKPERWRIEPLFFGVNFDQRFSLSKKN